MIRSQETLDQLLDTVSRFVAERLIPNEARLAAEDQEIDRMGRVNLSRRAAMERHMAKAGASES